MVEQQNTNQLREADNELKLVGILSENKLEATTVNGKDVIRGELEIETGEGSVHTVNIYANKLKKDGSESSLYKGMETVMNEYKSIAKYGREEADKVSITAGKLGRNEYFGQDEKLRSNPQLSTNFINRVQANEEYEPKAEFEVEIIVQNVIEEVDKQGGETGRVIVKAFIAIFGGRLVPFDFVVADPDAADYIRDNYEKGCTTRIFGDVINHVEIIKTEVEAAFGKNKVKEKRNYTKEFVITGGTPPYDEDDAKAYNVEVIKKALTERDVFLDELKNKKQNNQQGKKEEKKGFDTKSGAKKPKIDSSDLPF